MMDPQHPTPADIAHFDQSFAEINHMIDTLTNIYKNSLTTHRREETIIALAHQINHRSHNQEAVAQYLAVAIHRINELQQAALEIIHKYENITGKPPPGIIYRDTNQP